MNCSTSQKEHVVKHGLRREQRAVMYVRVSRADGDPNQAAIVQRHACERIANTYGVRIVREYADLGKPAEWGQQTELQRLLSDLAERQDASYVILSEYACLAQDLTNLDTIIRHVHHCGAEIATITGVEVAERFALSGLLDRVAEWANQTEPPAPYPLALLRAAHHGLYPRESLVVIAVLPNGETVRGSVTGIGGRLGVLSTTGQLVEDVQAEWVVSAHVQQIQEQAES